MILPSHDNYLEPPLSFNWNTTPLSSYQLKGQLNMFFSNTFSLSSYQFKGQSNMLFSINSNSFGVLSIVQNYISTIPPLMQALKWNQENADNSNYLDHACAWNSTYLSNVYTHPPRAWMYFLCSLSTCNVDFVTREFVWCLSSLLNYLFKILIECRFLQFITLKTNFYNLIV